MLTITDLFCGAGGSSSGAEQVPGVRVRMAANHWKLAVDTHQANLPHADHDCADISQVDPRRYPATDLLWASPSCTNHSQARGKRREDAQPDLFGQVLPDEAAERSRATMWDVCRFVEAMMLRGRPYRGFVVENVVDVRQWMFFDAWKTALRSAGYCLHEVFLNSMFAARLGRPAPQSRDRWYCVGHPAAGRCPDLDAWTRPAAHCPACDATVSAVQAWKRPDRPHGRYRAQYVYRCPNTGCRNAEVHPWVLPAAVAIDWSLPGERIGDRARPLAPKTIARIESGLRRYGVSLAVPVEGRDNVSARPVSAPLRTQTGRCETALVVKLRNNGTAKPASIPLDTVAAAGNHHALLVPAGGTWNDTAASTDEPFRTRTTRDTEALVVPPALVMRNMTARGDQGQMCTPVDEPIRTVVASNVQSLISMPWMTVPYYATGTARPVGEPIGTLTTRDRYAVCSVEPAVDDCLFRMLEPHEIQAAMAFSADYRILGNKRERTRQCGNAVTPPAARDLVAALVEAITGEHIEQTA